jgi:hypothetical protein
MQFLRQSALQDVPCEKPDGNVGVKVANARDADARQAGIARARRDINKIDHMFGAGQCVTNSRLVLNRIQEFHLLAMRPARSRPRPHGETAPEGWVSG